MWFFACRQLQERLEQPSDAVPHAGRQGKYSKCETHQKLKAWNLSSPFRQTTAYFCRLIPSFQCSQLAAKLRICNTTLCFVWVLEVKEDYHETRLQAEAMNSLESRQHFETLCGCLMIFVGFVCFCKCTAWNTPSSSFARSVTSLAFVRALPGNQTNWACPNTFGAQPESSGDIQWVRGGSMTCTWVLHGFCWKSYCSIHPKCNRSVQESFSVNCWNCTKTALFTVGTEKWFNASGLRPSSLQGASTKWKPNHKETKAQPALIELFCIVYELTHIYIYIYMHMLVFAYGAINDPLRFWHFCWLEAICSWNWCMHNWRHVTGLGWGGDVNVHVNLRHMHNWRHVTGLGWGEDVNVHVNLRHMHNWRHVTGWGGVGILTFMLTCVTCTTDVTSLGWGGVGMLTFMLTCVTCTTDVTSPGWGGVGMSTFMLTCVTCTTDVTSLGWGGVGMLTFMWCRPSLAGPGHNLWKELGKLAKKNQRWRPCKVSWKGSVAQWLVLTCN